jgi:hypothetical protein
LEAGKEFYEQNFQICHCAKGNDDTGPSLINEEWIKGKELMFNNN